MMTAELWQLISFFETEPTYLEDDYGPWPYCTALFESHVRSIDVRCELSPSYGDVAISIRRNDLRYEFSGRALRDVRYLNESGVETLELWLTRKHSISFQLKPELRICEQRTGTWESQFDN